MYEKLNPTLVRIAIKERIESRTDYDCYDKIPNDVAVPFYATPTVLQKPDDSKTMSRDTFECIIHAFADGKSSINIDNMTTALYEAFSDYIELDGYDVTLQQFEGVNQILAQSDGSDMAVTSLRITVLYGYKMKI